VALLLNTTGSFNNALGAEALLHNDSGIFNNAVGHEALLSNVGGSQNNALGDDALLNNVSGSFNTAIGDDALFNCNADSNTAVGDEAGNSIDSGDDNTCIGAGSGSDINSGHDNTCIGTESGADIDSGAGIVTLGAGQSGISSVAGQVNDATYISNIFNVPVDPATDLPVLVDADGKLGTTFFSSQRFKKEIRPMGPTSEAVLALKPVTFQYKEDKKAAPQFGLIAEEVAKVNPDLVIRDKKGEIVSVRYEAVNAMLLNEFLKEHKKVQDLEATVAQQQKGMEVLTTQLKEQAAQIQKVSAQLEVNKPAAQVVVNKP
jgi:trimeric autotransporter adhesin